MEHTCCWKICVSFLVALLLGVAGCQPSTPATAAKAKVETSAASPAASPAASQAKKPPQDFTSEEPPLDVFAGGPHSRPTEPKPRPLGAADVGDSAGRSARPATQTSEEPSEEEKPRDLGPPLVDELGDLKKLDPVSPVWLDMKHQQVVFQGEVCQANYPLEFLVTYPERGYESVMVVKVKPSVVHAGSGSVEGGARPPSPV